MERIQIGNVEVPIIEKQHLEAVLPNRKPNLSFTTTTLKEIWDDLASKDVASGASSTIDSTGFPIMNGGDTECHGMIVRVATPRSNAPTGPVNVDVSFINTLTDPESAADQDQTFQLMNYPPISSNPYTRRVKLAAIEYDYPNWAGPGNWPGYEIFAIGRDRRQEGAYESYNIEGRLWIDIPGINYSLGTNFHYDNIPDPGPENPFDPSDPSPYDPSHDDSSDLIGLPSDPPLGITSAGFINVYNPGVGALQGLGDIIFPNVASANDIVEAVIKLCETLANQNLINYVIDCHIIPVAPTVGNNANIKVGYRDTEISVPVVTSDYVSFSCGSLNIREYYGGFQDYVCTRSKLYLPMVGYVDMQPEFWQSGTISVDYKFNVIDGSFMCYVRSASSKSALAGSVIAQYGGNSCMHLPLTGVNYSNMISGLVQAAMDTAKGKPTLTNVGGGAYSALNTVALGGETQQSNGYNSTTAILGVRVPYLMIERLKPAWSSNYRHDKGLPSNIATTLSRVSGYTEISDIELSGIPFTDTEIEELRGILKDGVYF